MSRLWSTIVTIDRISDAMGRAVAWLTLGLVLITACDVVMRYLLNTTFVFIQELEWHLFSLIFLLAAGYGLRHDVHVRVDIFYDRMGRRGKAWINVLGAVLCLFPTCYLIVIASLPFVWHAWLDLEGSPDPGGVPFRFLLKAAIPVGYALLAFQGVAHLLKNVAIASGWPEPTREEGRSG